MACPLHRWSSVMAKPNKHHRVRELCPTELDLAAGGFSLFRLGGPAFMPSSQLLLVGPSHVGFATPTLALGAAPMAQPLTAQPSLQPFTADAAYMTDLQHGAIANISLPTALGTTTST